MKPRVYIETTIVSYLTARPSRSLENRVRQLSTQRWWSTRQANFECVASLLVGMSVAPGILTQPRYA